MKILIAIAAIAGVLLLISCKNKALTASNSAPTDASSDVQTSVNNNNPYYSRTDTTTLKVSNADWKKVLTPEVYAISRLKHTEASFTGKYWDFEGKGTYYCAACGNALFRSDSKFASSCGWPSFFEQLRPKSVVYAADNSYGMVRLEALCGRCGGHLGHLFDDGPEPTGKRYCMNSAVLDFEPDTKK